MMCLVAITVTVTRERSPQDEGNHGAFAGPRLSHQGCVLPCFHPERESLEHGHLWARRVAEVHVPEDDLPRDLQE